ncbi:MAG: hypothetical protein HGB36_09865 [Chlorobiaceae bacterium]|jgi:hypothetical protein|nr:hypothetical protein [Chlorobiaceae bacterium]
MSKTFSLLIAAVFLIFSSAFSAEKKNAVIKLDPQIALGSFKGTVEEHFSGILRTAKIIALTGEAKTGIWESVKPLLDEFSKELPTDAAAWYAMPDGSYYTTVSGTLTDQNLKDRPYFARLLAGQDVLGDLVISKTTHHRSVIVATPVTFNGKVVAVIGVSVRVRLLSDMVNAQLTLPDNTYFYALDPETKIVLHRFSDRMFKSVNNVGDESLGNEFKTIMNKDHGVFNYRLHGKNMTSIYQKSAPLGWYFFIVQEKK